MRIGFVGTGRATASLHLPALRRVHGTSVVALCDSDPARLDLAAGLCPEAERYEDYRTLLADSRVDLVAVCVPAALHVEIATAALRAGKHVFVEKPLALSLQECDRLVAEAGRAESAGRRSAVGFNLRSHRLLGQAKAIVAAGTLGEIELVRTLWSADWSRTLRPAWHASRASGGGALHEIGAHLADLWRWLLEAEVESVQAMSVSTEFDDQTATVQARMTTGTLVSAALSQRTVPHNVVEVLGSRGSLRLSNYHGDSLEVSATGGGSGLLRRAGPILQRVSQLPGAIRAARGGGDFTQSYARQWACIAKALTEGGPMPATVEDGRRSVAVVLAALRSAAGGGAAVPVSLASLQVEPRVG